ncbi:hypothetical protein [Proteiniphilum sp. UBA5384]|jgi:hypothetical protein|uniref:hypothetical protein n=1 Tax=Proteiniphilum sp. UBA5384 TaxID=1947279 RepID=UPI0025F8FA16|nr:hypothetical protein [Proteiniphilum sp. UBA5384]
MDTKDRLKLFVKEKGYGRNKFEELIGISIGYLSTKNETINSDVIEKTKTFFPDLNLDWLITGKGEMVFSSIKSNPAEQSIDVVEEEAVEYKNKYLEVLEENRLLRIEIEKLRKIIKIKEEK